MIFTTYSIENEITSKNLKQKEEEEEEVEEEEEENDDDDDDDDELQQQQQTDLQSRMQSILRTVATFAILVVVLFLAVVVTFLGFWEEGGDEEVPFLAKTVLQLSHQVLGMTWCQRDGSKAVIRPPPKKKKKRNFLRDRDYLIILLFIYLFIYLFCYCLIC